MRHILKDSFIYIFDDFQIILQKNLEALLLLQIGKCRLECNEILGNLIFMMIL